MTSEPPKPTWTEIEALQEALVERFPDDTFLKTVLAGCYRVARDDENPLRGNLLASGLRELVGHLLHQMAPDENVRNCAWFEQAKDTTTVTRRQRASFIIHAGLPIDFVSENLKLDVKAFANPLIEAMDELSKATHVRPETIISDGPCRISAMEPPTTDRILRIGTVLDRTGLSRSTLYRKIKAGEFPNRVQISTNCVGWRESSVTAWLEDPMRYSSADPHNPQ